MNKEDVKIKSEEDIKYSDTIKKMAIELASSPSRINSICCYHKCYQPSLVLTQNISESESVEIPYPWCIQHHNWYLEEKEKKHEERKKENESLKQKIQEMHYELRIESHNDSLRLHNTLATKKLQPWSLLLIAI